MNLPWLFFALALLAGMLITVQIGSNARLKEAFGEALPAVIVSSSLGIILLVAATLTALVVTGQLLCSVVLDHFGWIGFTEHAAGAGRLLGCLLMVAGFFLIARF